MKNILLFLAALITTCIFACKQQTSPSDNKDTTQTTLAIKNKKVAVINNPDKNYSKLATVPDPCIKCLIGVVQKTDEFKKTGLAANSSDVKYEINWVAAQTTADSASKSSPTNAVRLDVMNKNKPGKALASFIYDNTNGKLYFFEENSKKEIIANANDSKAIRRTCYWGVASAK